MKATPDNQTHTAEELSELQARLVEAEETLEAIRDGSVDALVIKGPDQAQQIFTLELADDTYQLMIESMSEGAITVSETGTVLYSNPQFSTMAGQPLKNIIGSPLQSFIFKNDAVLLSALLSEGSKDDKRAERSLRLNNKTKTEVIMSARRLPHIDDDNYMCIIVTDMTERKKGEFAKDEFISLASHQLRTPATGVKQYIGMLLEGYAGELTLEQQFFAKTGYDSNERQLSIIDSILKTAKIDSGAYVLQKSCQNLKDLIEETLREFRPMLTMRKQKVIRQLDGSINVMIEAGEIGLVITNLIENASKYSPQGNTFNITLHKKAGFAYLVVADTGVGISHSNHEKVFDKFIRVNNPLSDTVSGNGLGLYWVKKIVELHGGTIDLTSKIHKGSTFTIKLPL